MRVQFGARLAGLVLLLAAGLAHAEDPIVERAWFEDRTGEMTLEEVKRQAFTPFEGNLSRGFGSAPLWVRLTIDPSRIRPGLLAPDTLILRVLSTLMLEIQLLDSLQPDRLMVTGLLPNPEVEVPGSSYPSFALPRGDGPREVWLKLSSHHTRYAPIEVLSVDEWTERKLTEARLAALFLVVLMTFLLWAAWSYREHRDRVLLLFVMYMAGFTGYSLVVLGEHRRWLFLKQSPSLVDPLMDAVILFASSIMALFAHELMREYRPPVALMRLLIGSSWAFALLWPVAVLGYGEWAFFSYNALIAVAALLPPLCALTSRPLDGAESPVIPAGWLGGIFSLSFLIVLLNALNVLGLMPDGISKQWFALANGPLIGALLFIYLQVRMSRITEARAHANSALEAAVREWNLEKCFRQEREELLAMLAHEIKTPLSTMKISLAGHARVAPSVTRAMGDMEAIIDRCVQLGLMEGAQINLSQTPCELGEVLAQVAEDLGCADRVDWSEAHSCMLYTDRRLLEVIVRNLLDNAGKYGSRTAPIGLVSQLQAREGKEGVEIRIANLPGEAGWPEEDRLFSKYYRSHGARRSSGSGLGLYLVAGLVRMLGGSVEYRPSATHLQFIVWLPLGCPEAP